MWTALQILRFLANIERQINGFISNTLFFFSWIKIKFYFSLFKSLVLSKEQIYHFMLGMVFLNLRKHLMHFQMNYLRFAILFCFFFLFIEIRLWTEFYTYSNSWQLYHCTNVYVVSYINFYLFPFNVNCPLCKLSFFLNFSLSIQRIQIVGTVKKHFIGFNHFHFLLLLFCTR